MAFWMHSLTHLNGVTTPLFSGFYSFLCFFPFLFAVFPNLPHALSVGILTCFECILYVLFFCSVFRMCYDGCLFV